MSLRALCALFVLGTCLSRAEPECAAAERPQPTGASTQLSRTQPEVLDVWLRGEEPAWTARAEGQLSDLPVRVHVISEPVEADPEQQLASGKAVHAMGLVAWLWPEARETGRLSPEGQGTYLLVWSAPAERLYVRRVGPVFEPSEDSEWSATLEIAALALRTAVRAALAGSSLGVETPRRSLPGATGQRGVRAATALPAGNTRDVQWLGAVRAIVARDGQTDVGLGSCGAELQLVTRAWRVGALAEVGFASTLDSRQAKLFLRRHVAAAVLGRVWALPPTLRLIGQLSTGVAWFHRETRAEVTELDATEANTTPSALFGVAGGLEWAPLGPSFVALEVGVAWVPGAPTLRLIHDDGRNLASHRLWQLEPQAGLRLGFGW